MSTATQTKPAIDDSQREWLKKMGAALQVDVNAQQGQTATGAATSPTAAGAIGKEAATEPAKDGPPINVAGKPTLKKGSKGQDVKDLQTLLNKNGATLEVDGDFGKLTDAAVKDFQKKNPPLVVDGIVGEKTWAALAAKQEPPKPDTKPRRAVVLVTNVETNDAVEDAEVKIADKSEKTGNTGQATFSLPPGKYPYGVTANGYEQAVGTLEVTDKDESQLRVEMKGGQQAKGSKTELTVSPPEKSFRGDKIVLTATVTMADGKTTPVGYVLFEVSLKKGGAGRQILKKVEVKDGKAVHTEDLLPDGDHLLHATYVPTPPSPTNVGSQAQPVPHNVTDTEYHANLRAVKKLLAELKSHVQQPQFTKEIAAAEAKLKDAQAKFDAKKVDEATKQLKALKSECSKLKTKMDMLAKGIKPDRAEQIAEVSQSLVDSGIDPEKAQEVGQLTNLGGSGDVRDAKLVAAQIAELPLDVIKGMRAKGTKVVACRGNITDHHPEFKGVQPRGWPDGSTWDTVPGVFMPDSNEVVIATRGHGTAGGPHVPATGDGHGSFDLATHEAMHGYDHGGDPHRHEDKAFIEARKKDLAKLGPYYTQPGEAGLEETYAESAARYYGKDKTMKTDWPNLYKYWDGQPK